MDFTALQDYYSDVASYLTSYFSRNAGLTVNANDLLVEVDKAWRVICSFVGATYDLTDTETLAKYATVLADLSKAYTNNMLYSANKMKGEKTSISEGSLSISYSGAESISIDADGLTPEIRAMLKPRHYFHVFG